MAFSIKNKLIAFSVLLVFVLSFLIVLVIGLEERHSAAREFRESRMKDMSLVRGGVEILFSDAANSVKMLAGHKAVMASDESISNYTESSAPVRSNGSSVSRLSGR